MSSVQNLITSRILVSFKFLNEPRPFQATERLRLFLEAVKDISIKDETVTCRMQSCVGCQNCVIACSYHHKRVFSRAVSSLDVKRLEGTNFEAALPRINNSHIACDRCVGLREPVCVKYCPSIAKAELANFLREAWRVLDLV